MAEVNRRAHAGNRNIADLRRTSVGVADAWSARTSLGRGLGQWALDYVSRGEHGSGVDVSKLDSAAFASGAFIDLTASCNAAAPSEKGSLLSQFASKVDEKSRIRGVRGTVDFGTEPADTEGELVKGGRDRSKSSWWNILWAPGSRVVERKGASGAR